MYADHVSYDPEATIQEADILMAEYAAEAADFQAARDAGRCTHNSTVGLPDSGKVYYPEQEGLKPGQVACTSGCGEVFDDEDDWYDAMMAAVYN